jgi:hypothetical protein
VLVVEAGCPTDDDAQSEMKSRRRVVGGKRQGSGIDIDAARACSPAGRPTCTSWRGSEEEEEDG